MRQRFRQIRPRPELRYRRSSRTKKFHETGNSRMKEIVPRKPSKTSVTVPGSKSYTHRILVASALSDGPCTVTDGLKSEDTLLTAGALRQLGVRVEDQGDTVSRPRNRGAVERLRRSHRSGQFRNQHAVFNRPGCPGKRNLHPHRNRPDAAAPHPGPSRRLGATRRAGPIGRAATAAPRWR